MAIRWREHGSGELLCAATHPEQKDDLYINDELHYWLAVTVKVLVPDKNERDNGRWYWRRETAVKEILENGST